MKKKLLALSLILLLFSSCQTARFERQQYTDLHPLKITHSNAPPDSVKHFNKKRVYLQTEDGLYRVTKPHYDTTENKIVSRNIHGALNLNPKKAMIIHMDEEDFVMVNEIEVESIDSVSIERKAADPEVVRQLDNPYTHKLHQSRKPKSRYEAHQRRVSNLRGLSILFGLLAATYGFLLWFVWRMYKNFLKSKENQGCGGAIVALLYIIAIWAAATATSIFLVIFAFCLATFLTERNALKRRLKK